MRTFTSITGIIEDEVCVCVRERQSGLYFSRDVISSMQTTVVFTFKVSRCLSGAQLGQDKELGVITVRQDPNKHVFISQWELLYC